MRQTFSFYRNKSDTSDTSDKVNAELVSYVYEQADFALLASFICAIIVFIGLFSIEERNIYLYIWFGIYLVITFSRIILVNTYKQQHFPFQHNQFWRNLYIIGAALGGMSWGLAALILMPISGSMERVLIVLMLAGVTAGSVPLSLGIASASIMFLLFSLIPFIFHFALSSLTVNLLFSVAITVYLFYSIILTMRGAYTIKKSVVLQFENAALLENLSEAKYQLELSNEKLEYAATHDPLTHVANRNLFQLNLAKAIKLAEIKQKGLALFYLDLDRFKNVNDIYGHQIGDSVLIIIISRLTNFFHGKEDIARLGGEEFAIILKDINSTKEVEKIAKQLCQVIAEPILIKKVEKIYITASIGVSIFPDDGRTIESLLTQADNFMYLAKEDGGNRYHIKKAYVNE